MKPEAYAAFCMGVQAMESGKAEEGLDWLEKAVREDPDSVACHIWAGLLCDEQLQRPAKAKEHFEAALRLDPKNFQARCGIARQLLRSGQTEKGRAELLIAIESPEAKRDPGLVARAYTDLAVGAESRRQWDEAAEWYAKGARVSPEPAPLLLRLSHVYQRAGQNEKAADALRAVAVYVPAYARIHRELSNLYNTMGKWKEAYEELSTFMRHRNGPGEQTHLLREAAELAERAGRPQDARTLYEKILVRLEKDLPAEKPAAELCEEISTTLQSLERYGEAEPYLRKAIESAEADGKPRLRSRLASLYQKLRQFDKAAAELTQCVEAVEPKASIRYRTELASVLESAGKQAEAESALKAILEIPGAKDTAHAELGLFHSRRGDVEKAVGNLLEAIKLAETERGLRYRIQLSIVYAEAKRDREAEQVLVEAKRLSPENASINNALGWFYAERAMNLDKALDLVRAALKDHPNNPYFLDSLGWVYFKQGRAKDALEHLLKAASLAEDGAISDHLGDVYLQLGDGERASEQWKRSLELNPQMKGVREKLEKVKKGP